MKFVIEQIALCPGRIPGETAVALLTLLGWNAWSPDRVRAAGEVRGLPAENTAQLHFNYEAGRSDGKPLELEMLHYEKGANWMEGRTPSVSHIGMHVTEDELSYWTKELANLGIPVAQAVLTHSHTNPAIAGKRWYKYVIFDTRQLIGVDLKFIVRRESAPEGAA